MLSACSQHEIYRFYTLYLFMSTYQTEDPRGGETDLGRGETVVDVHAQTA